MRSAIALTLVACWTAAPSVSHCEAAEKPARAAGPQRAFISFRIGTPQWMPPNRFDELLGLFEKHKGVTDEITLFLSATHPPLPLDEAKRRCELAAVRMAAARKLGYRLGINVLATIGHHNENLPNSLQGDYTRLTDPDGNVCQGAFCPNDGRVRKYVGELYAAAAAAGPDYLWIDDDVRLAGHMPIHLTCFCDGCLAIFAREIGVRYTRPELKAAFTAGSMEKRLELRKAWLRHNRATIARLFELIERTVHGVRPGLPLGFMTGDRFYEGYDFDGWARVLAGPDPAEVLWRPGGGFYEDSWISGLAGKSHDVGRQVAMLPVEVLSIQSEIENFPYHRLKKAAHTTVLEAASHMAAGCTGAAFNVLSGNDEPLDEFEPLVARIREVRPFLDLLARHLGRSPLAGVWPAWGKDTAAACDLAGGNWSAFGRFLGEVPQTLEIGLPAAYARQGAAVTLLSDDSVRAFGKEEILKILAGGVYLDAAALSLLNELGYQDLTGLAVDRVFPIDCIEELSSHPLNGPFAGRQRDCRQSFYHLPGHALKKLDPRAEVLARLVDYSGREVAPASMAVFENRLGGRVCVAGYFPWTFVHSLSKSAQMKSVLRWLSRDTLPAYVESFHRINLWARVPGEGKVAIALTNSSLDPARELTLAVRTDRAELRVLDMAGRETLVRRTARDGPYGKFVLPAIDPWHMRLVVAGLE